MAKWEGCIVLHSPYAGNEDDLIELEFSSGKRSVLRGSAANIGEVMQDLFIKHWDLVGSCTADDGRMDMYFLKRGVWD
jgi:hypothetical protein